MNYFKKEYSFLPALILIFTLLLLIPILIKIKLLFIAKFIGFFLVLFVPIILNFWLKRSSKKKKILNRIKISVNEKFWLDKHVLFYRQLSKVEQKVFEDRIALFIANIKISNVNDDILEKEEYLIIASSAIIAFWKSDSWSSSDLNEILVINQNCDSLETNINSNLKHGDFFNNTLVTNLSILKNEINQKIESPIWQQLI